MTPSDLLKADLEKFSKNFADVARTHFAELKCVGDVVEVLIDKIDSGDFQAASFVFNIMTFSDAVIKVRTDYKSIPALKTLPVPPYDLWLPFKAKGKPVEPEALAKANEIFMEKLRELMSTWRIVKAGPEDLDEVPKPSQSEPVIPVVTPSRGVIVNSKLPVLQQTIPFVSNELRTLQQVLVVDISSSLNKIRYIAEKILLRLCRKHEVSWGQAEPTLERMLGSLTSKQVLPRNVSIHVRTIQTYTSPGSHYQEFALSESHAIIAQQALVELLEWFASLPDESSQKASN